MSECCLSTDVSHPGSTSLSSSAHGSFLWYERCLSVKVLGGRGFNARVIF